MQGWISLHRKILENPDSTPEEKTAAEQKIKINQKKFKIMNAKLQSES